MMLSPTNPIGVSTDTTHTDSVYARVISLVISFRVRRSITCGHELVRRGNEINKSWPRVNKAITKLWPCVNNVWPQDTTSVVY